MWAACLLAFGQNIHKNFNIIASGKGEAQLESAAALRIQCLHEYFNLSDGGGLLDILGPELSQLFSGLAKAGGTSLSAVVLSSFSMFWCGVSWTSTRTLQAT